MYIGSWYFVVTAVEAATSAIQNDDDIALGAGRGNFFALLYGNRQRDVWIEQCDV